MPSTNVGFCLSRPFHTDAALEPVAKRLTEKFPDVLVCVSSNIGVAANIERIGLHLPEVLGSTLLSVFPSFICNTEYFFPY